MKRWKNYVTVVNFLDHNTLTTERIPQEEVMSNTFTRIFNVVYINWDSEVSSDAICSDFQEAFDKIPHERLLRKLKSHGIGDELHTVHG